MRENAKTSLELTQEFLHSISTELRKDLSDIIQGDWGLTNQKDIDNVFLIDVEVFADGYGMAAYPMDKDLTQLGYKELLANYPDGPLRGIKFGLDINSYDFENEEDLKEINEYYSSLTDFYFNWVSKCWDEVGGQVFITPIYLLMHDSNQSFDLCNKKWVEDIIKWPDE